MKKKEILFICTHNSARSQMAEGLVNHFLKDTYRAYSAGIEKTHVKSLAIKALQEMGIDISHHFSKTIDDLKNKHFDLVITVCNNAKENCPYFPNAKKTLHLPFIDPSDTTGSHGHKLKAFIKTRDQILNKLKKILL